MKYRSFGADAINISEVGLGCWQLGGTEWGEVSVGAHQSLRDFYQEQVAPHIRGPY